MFTQSGVGLDVWASIDDAELISHEVAGDQVQIRFGEENGPRLLLVLSEEHLKELMSHGTQALQALQQVPQRLSAQAVN